MNIKKINPLTKKQIKAIPKPKGKQHVRFLVAGQACNIETGEVLRKGTNIMYHPVYWCMAQETIDQCLACLQENNPEYKFTISSAESP